MTLGRQRIGLVGVGIIAETWVPALRAAHLDVTAVSSRPESTRVRDFAARHGIPQAFESWEAMLEAPECWDALLIATWPDGTPDVLRRAMELERPVLVEKPVAWNSRTQRDLCARPHDGVIVGYNRRFYRSVQRARREALDGPPLVASLILPTDVAVPTIADPTGRYMQQFYESVSAHGLDLTRFILGDLRVESVQRLRNGAGNVAGLSAMLATARGDLVQLGCPWGTSANYSLTLARPGWRMELLPFEIATIYQGMEVLPPSAEYPVRRYTPKVAERVLLDGVDLEQKPGFMGQIQALQRLLDGCPPPAEAARLEDALAVTLLCEQLTGVTLGDCNPSTYH